jgi:hypothetical protein
MKTKYITLPPTAGRDAGKQFLITEMSAIKAEKWAGRALFAMGRGMDIPDNIRDAGMAAMGILGLKSLLSIKWEDAEPLLDEMLTCIQIIPDPKRNPTFLRNLTAEDIEEVKTLLDLRLEVFALHTGFSSGADLLSSAKATMQPAVEQFNTQTSQEQSE